MAPSPLDPTLNANTSGPTEYPWAQIGKRFVVMLSWVMRRCPSDAGSFLAGRDSARDYRRGALNQVIHNLPLHAFDLEPVP